MKENSEITQNISIYEYNKLKELRNTIYNQDLFNMKELKDKIKTYPGKYLNIINNNYDNLNCNFYSKILQIKYSNKFCKLTINELISDLENQMEHSTNNIKGSGGGINFEKKVINSILFNTSQVFGQCNYHKRKIFSLVGKTENSKNTINNHRDEEKNNYLYDFYNIKEYSDKIDDIDYESNLKEIELTENLYLIIQASKTGRSFDFAILKRIDESNNWFLYLFQATINKTSELKSKATYIIDAIICESYLNKLYKIKISKTFFIFIIPFDFNDISFTTELEKRNIYYIFYKLGSFYDKRNSVVSSLNFSGAEIIQEKLDQLNKYQSQIEKSLNAWDESVQKFLRRKRKKEKLSKYYKRSLLRIGGKGIQLKLTSELKNKIIDALYINKMINNKEYELLFVGNCIFENLETIIPNKNLVIFFMIKNDYYFYFEKYYQLTNENFTKITKKPKRKASGKYNYTKKVIDINEINEKSNLCFCL